MHTILVMEDEIITRKVICSLLKKAGFITIEAENGYEGLEKAKNNLPDLIVSDIIMPVMNGIEALKIKCSDKKIAEIPVVFLSSSSEFANEAINYGAKAFLEKSCLNSELIKVINENIRSLQKLTA